MKQGRISELQRRVIAAIAEYISNNTSDNGHSLWLKYSDLYHLVYPDAARNRKEYLSRRASLSRSVRDLIENKRLVSGLALAWICKEDGYEDLYRWQGGGRKRTDLPGYSFKDSTPTYRMFALSPSGEKLVREIGPLPSSRDRPGQNLPLRGPKRPQKNGRFIPETDSKTPHFP